jgi:hypothetical protein
MIRETTMVLLLASLYGCATTGSYSTDRSIELASDAFHSKDFIVDEIPSHGALGDAAAISLGGGANAAQLRDFLVDSQQSGDPDRKKIAVTSRNSALAKAVLVNAVKDLEPDSLSGVWIACTASLTA